MTEKISLFDLWRQTFADPRLAFAVILPPAAMALVLTWLIEIPFELSLPFWQTVFTTVFFSGMMFIWLRHLLIGASPREKIALKDRFMRLKVAFHMVKIVLVVLFLIGTFISLAMIVVLPQEPVELGHTAAVPSALELFFKRWFVLAALIAGVFVTIILNDPLLPVRTIGLDPWRLRDLPDMQVQMIGAALGLAVIWGGIGAFALTSEPLWAWLFGDTLAEPIAEALQQLCLGCAGLTFSTLIAQPFLVLKRAAAEPQPQAPKSPAAPRPTPAPQPEKAVAEVLKPASPKPHRAPFRRYKPQ